MALNFIFSWAENGEGRMVHVDDVPRGLKCGCVCPNCHEKLVARHGDVKEHGFAHHSETRRANLQICYMVIMYKLAEQILQTRKHIHAPSYYGIFKEQDIEFVDVKIDGHYEREDKQPDVIATGRDGKQYLIEFVFQYKVQHKKELDYKNLTCLEVDLSNQTLETLETFLLNSSEDRRWLNNENYFNQIEERYINDNKLVKVVTEEECKRCLIKNRCCAIMKSFSPLVIENSGKKYRLCKTELFQKEMEQELELQQKEREQKERERLIDQQRQKEQAEARARAEAEEKKRRSSVTCYNCQNNLSWGNKYGFAACGIAATLGIPSKIEPEHAEQCRGFRNKYSQ